MIEAKEEVRWCSIIWQQNLHLILHNTPNIICVANDSRRHHLAVAPVYGACQLCWTQTRKYQVNFFLHLILLVLRVAPLPAHPPLLRPELSGLSLSLHVVIGWREHKAQTNLGIKAKYVISFPLSAAVQQNLSNRPSENVLNQNCDTPSLKHLSF